MNKTLFKSGSELYLVSYVHCSCITNRKKGMNTLNFYFSSTSVCSELDPRRLGGTALFIDPYGRVKCPQNQGDIPCINRVNIVSF